MGVLLNEARAPDGMRIYAIGDVHGCLIELRAIHEAIREDLERSAPEDFRVVHLGDYVNWGPNSRGVIDLLVRCQEDDSRWISLIGNHEMEMYSLMDGMPPSMSSHLDFAAASYGVYIDRSDDIARHYDRIRDAIPKAHRAFLRDLPIWLELGDYFFSHAGIAPGRPIEGQYDSDLIWGSRDFHGHDGVYEKVIVHGHTPDPLPRFRKGRVCLDSGACENGTLTCLVLEEDGKRLMVTSPRLDRTCEVHHLELQPMARELAVVQAMV